MSHDFKEPHKGMVALTKDKCQCVWGRGRQLCTGHRAHPARPWLLAPNTPTRSRGPGSHGGPPSGLQRACQLTCYPGHCSSCREAVLTGGKLRHSQLAVCLSHGKQQQSQSQSEANSGVPAHSRHPDMCHRLGSPRRSAPSLPQADLHGRSHVGSHFLFKSQGF